MCVGREGSLPWLAFSNPLSLPGGSQRYQFLADPRSESPCTDRQYTCLCVAPSVLYKWQHILFSILHKTGSISGILKLFLQQDVQTLTVYFTVTSWTIGRTHHCWSLLMDIWVSSFLLYLGNNLLYFFSYTYVQVNIEYISRIRIAELVECS